MKIYKFGSLGLQEKFLLNNLTMTTTYDNHMSLALEGGFVAPQARTIDEKTLSSVVAPSATSLAYFNSNNFNIEGEVSEKVEQMNKNAINIVLKENKIQKHKQNKNNNNREPINSSTTVETELLESLTKNDEYNLESDLNTRLNSSFSLEIDDDHKKQLKTYKGCNYIWVIIKHVLKMYLIQYCAAKAASLLDADESHELLVEEVNKSKVGEVMECIFEIPNMRYSHKEMPDKSILETVNHKSKEALKKGVRGFAHYINNKISCYNYTLSNIASIFLKLYTAAGASIDLFKTYISYRQVNKEILDDKELSKFPKSIAKYYTGDINELSLLLSRRGQTKFRYIQLKPSEHFNHNKRLIKIGKHLEISVLTVHDTIVTRICDMKHQNANRKGIIYNRDITLLGLKWTMFNINIAQLYPTLHTINYRIVPMMLIRAINHAIDGALNIIKETNNVIISNDKYFFSIITPEETGVTLLTSHQQSLLYLVDVEHTINAQSGVNKHSFKDDYDSGLAIYNENVQITKNKGIHRFYIGEEKAKHHRRTIFKKDINPTQLTEKEVQATITLKPNANTRSNPVMSVDPENTGKERKYEQNLSTNGSSPRSGLSAEIYGYIARYYNVFKFTKIPTKQRIQMECIAAEFRNELKKLIGQPKPFYTDDQKRKYKRYLNGGTNIWYASKKHSIFTKAEQYAKLNRNRVITDCNKIVTVKLLKFVNAMHEKLKEHFAPYAPGKNKTFFDTTKIPDHLGCDYSGLDGSIKRFLRIMVESIMFEIYPEHEKEIRDLLNCEWDGIFVFKDSSIDNEKHCIFVPTNGTRLSGSALTSLMNTLVVIFLQYLFYRMIRKLDMTQSMARLGWAYGDDTTMPGMDIKDFSVFVKKYFGMTVTIEKSKYPGITFLSEIKLGNQTQHDLARMASKYSTCFNKATGILSLVYKDLGYYNPKKCISNSKDEFYQAPFFSILGRAAHCYMIKKRNLTKSFNVEQHMKLAYKKYDQLSTHKIPTDYRLQLEKIVIAHKALNKEFDVYSKEVNKSASGNQLRNAYYDFKGRALKLYTKYFLVQNTVGITLTHKAVALIDDHPVSDKEYEIKTENVESLIAFAKTLPEYQRMKNLQQHYDFWKFCSTYLKLNLGAAAKKIADRLNLEIILINKNRTKKNGKTKKKQPKKNNKRPKTYKK